MVGINFLDPQNKNKNTNKQRENPRKAGKEKHQKGLTQTSHETRKANKNERQYLLCMQRAHGRHQVFRPKNRSVLGAQKVLVMAVT